MKRIREQLIGNVQQRSSQIGGDIFWADMSPQHRGEERSRRRNVASFRDVHVDHLAMLVDSAVDVLPDSGDFDVGLICEPAVPNTVPAWSCRGDE
jgi:hypothetical protein